VGNYYFLAASLPPLSFGEKPDISFDELSSRLKINLNKVDYKKSEVLRRLIDLGNIRCLLTEEAIDSRGNLSEKELDEALLVKADLPLYAFDFLERFETAAEKLRFFPGLLATYFNEEGVKQRGFLKEYLQFERAWRLIILALRAKELGRDIEKELAFEDPKDPLVADILAQKGEISYTPFVEYADLKEKFLSCGKDPWQQYRVVTEWRMSHIEEIVQSPLFSIDWILSYIARLLLVEQWCELDPEKGKVILEAFLE
jgi:hypothetical protein